ncbi:MAG: FAD-linked oxidase C-terminal domain-containing protein [Planctomycetota bacterium]
MMRHPELFHYLDELRAVLPPDAVMTAEEDLQAYHSDETRIPFPPECVVFPETTGQVSEIMKFATRYRIPVTPRGGGSGLTGGALPVQGGILLVTTRMNRILEIDKANMTATAQPGIILKEFQTVILKEGLFYPPDPNSFESCCLGGTIAENAGGPKTVKYGVTSNYVMGLEVVLPDGEIIRTGGKNRKCVAGYDLTKLFIGSEGTFGVVTEITVRLIGNPEAVRTMVALFPDFRDAARAVAAIMAAKIIPSTLEFLDILAIRLVRKFLNMSVSCAVDYLLLEAGENSAFLLIEVDGLEAELEANLREIGRICMENQAGETRILTTQSERDRIWLVRRSIKTSITAVCKYEVSEDIVVPIAMIPNMTECLQVIAKEFDVDILNYGHFGDGNMHVNILSYEGTPEHMKKMDKIVARVFDETLKRGGTISGEHGIGVTKADFLENEVGTRVMQLYAGLKNVFDPLGILNPGKMSLDRFQGKIRHGSNMPDTG